MVSGNFKFEMKCLRLESAKQTGDFYHAELRFSKSKPVPDKVLNDLTQQKRDMPIVNRKKGEKHASEACKNLDLIQKASHGFHG